MAVILVAAFEGDVGEAQSGVGEQLFGGVQAGFQNKFLGRKPRLFAEDDAEMVFAIARGSRQLVQVDGGHVVFADIGDRVIDVLGFLHRRGGAAQDFDDDPAQKVFDCLLVIDVFLLEFVADGLGDVENLRFHVPEAAAFGVFEVILQAEADGDHARPGLVRFSVGDACFDEHEGAGGIVVFFLPGKAPARAFEIIDELVTGMPVFGDGARTFVVADPDVLQLYHIFPPLWRLGKIITSGVLSVKGDFGKNP